MKKPSAASQSSTAKLPHSPLVSRLSLQRARCPCLSPGGSPAQLTCVSLCLLIWLPLPLTPISSHPWCNLSSKNLEQLYKRSLNSIAWQPAKVLVAQLCLTLCDLMDCSPLGSSVHGIFQARILEWVAIPFSRGSSQLLNLPYEIEPQSPSLQADSLPSEPPGKPILTTKSHPQQWRKKQRPLIFWIILGEKRAFREWLWGFLEKANVTHSSTLAWKIPWTEEPGGLQSVGSLRVGHDWASSLSLFTFLHWRRKWQPTPVLLPGESQGRGSLVGCRLWGHTESDMTEVT